MNEPWHLLDGYFDGELTFDEELQLRNWLAGDAEHVRVFVKEAHLHHLLRRQSMASLAVRASIGDAELGSRVVTAPVEEATRGTPIVAFPEPLGRQRRSKARTVFALAASIGLLVGGMIWLFPRTNDEPTLTLGSAAAATIERGTETFAALDRMKLDPGDVLRATGTNAGAAISYAPESTRVELRSGTELKLASRSRGKRFELRAGALEATVARQRPFKPLLIRTPQAEARVLGTKFTLTAATNATRLDVAEGRVRLTRTSDGARVDVAKDHYAIAAATVELAALPQTGSILREYWTNILGGIEEPLLNLTEDRRFPDHPNGRELLTRLEVSPNWGDNFGDRIRGYLHPPKTGAYVFFLSGDQSSSLLLSRDDDPDNKIPTAWVERSDTEESTKSPSQQSTRLTLTAGKRYYIEVLRHCGTGPDHLSVAWQPPGGQFEVIPGEFLSPFKPQNRKEKKP